VYIKDTNSNYLFLVYNLKFYPPTYYVIFLSYLFLKQVSVPETYLDTWFYKISWTLSEHAIFVHTWH